MSTRARDKVLRAYSETGVAGVARRGLRVASARLRLALHDLERLVLRVEFNERIREFAPLLERNTRFAAAHEGQTAFVIGNGPSLKGIDLGFTERYPTFCVNAFWRHPNIAQLQPTYYLFTDGRLFDGTPDSVEFIRDLVRHVPNTNYFIPLEHRAFVSDLRLLPPDRTFFLALNGYLPDFDASFPDLTTVVMSPPTVVQTAILVAIYMGFERVVLLGCDHNWLDEFGHDDHFYEEQTAGHVDGSEGRDDYLHMMNFVRNVWQGYKVVRGIANEAGVQVVNATRGGRLDVFPRMKLEDVLSSG